MLSIIFTILGISVGILYLFKKPRFSFEYLFLSLWLIAVGVAQLRLSPYEESWDAKFWLILLLFFAILLISQKYASKVWVEKIKDEGKKIFISKSNFWIALAVMTLASIVANIYIAWRFGTLPIISSIPDKMRFIINREVFGLWEYLALLPRIFIPVSFLGFFFIKNKTKTDKILLTANIFIGLIILSLYASRVIIIFSILLCFFSYLILNIKTIHFKKVILSSLICVLIVLSVSVAIPGIRQYITYKDYYSDIDYSPFTYLADLSQIDIPESLEALIPLYLIPSFNLQALMRSTDFFTADNYYLGGYSLSVFRFLPSITVPWKAIFLPWWVTGTFLFSWWADFGLTGMVLAGVFMGIILSGVYQLATKKPSLFSVLLFGYFSFFVIMTIYTNYFLREEFYLDILVLIILGAYLSKEKYNLAN